MDQKKLAPALSDKEYAVAFAGYRTQTNQAQYMLDWLTKHLEFIVSKQDHLSVLSVGAGNGEFDLAMIPILQSKVSKLSYTALDPNISMLEQFKADFCSREYKDIELEIRNCMFEQFVLEKPHDFGLVHFTHCLYFIPDRLGAIQKALNMVEDDGVVLIFNSMLAGIQDIRNRFTERARGTPSLIFAGEQLKKILDEQHMKYQFQLIESVTDITECFKNDSHLGRLLLNFFLVCDSRQISKSLRAELFDYLKLISFQENGRILMPHPIGAFCIF